MASSGSASLEIPFDNQGDTSRWVEIGVTLCSGDEPVDLRGRTIHWEVRLDPPPAAQYSGYNVLRAYEDADTGYLVEQFVFDSSGWAEHEILLTGSIFASIRSLDFYLSQDIDWSGTIRFDNIYTTSTSSELGCGDQ